MRVRISLALLVALGLLLSATAPAPAGAAYQQTSIDMGDTAWANSPEFDWDTDGRTVVWRDTPDGSSEHPGAIHAARLNGGERIVVAGGSQYDPGIRARVFPRVSGDTVAWVEYSSDSSWIVVHNIPSGEQSVIGSHGWPFPTIDLEGDWIVWIGFSDDMAFVQARNLAVMGETLTLAQQPHVTCPHGCPPPLSDAQVSGGHVVWRERFSGEGVPQVSRLVRYDLATGETTVVSETDTGLFDVGGDVVAAVSADWRTLNAYDLVTGELSVLTHEDSSGLGNPITDGRFVFWQDTSGEIFGHDLVTGAALAFPPGMELLFTPERGVNGLIMAAVGNQVRVVPATELVEGRAWRSFTETGHSLGFDFLRRWEASGGLMTFGYPLSDVIPEHAMGLPAQYFERQRFEYQLQHIGSPYEVELGRLGDEVLLSQGRHWLTFPRASSDALYYFDVTGHAIDPRFWDYWSSRGLELGDPGVSLRESVALFGYPISEPALETNADGDTVLTQWFERAAFEWHPDNPDPWKVLLRRLGAEVLATAEQMEASQ